MGIAVKRQLEQPVGSLLRLVRILHQNGQGKGATLYETACECDGSFCGSHDGICGNIRILDAKSFTHALACKSCNTARSASVLAASAKLRRLPNSPEIDEALRMVYGLSRDYGRGDSSHTGSLTLKEITLRFGRTRGYLRRRAEELNLPLRQVKRHSKWSEEEQRILERNAHLSCEAIQKRLVNEGYKRTISAIRDRITLHNLRQGTPYFRQEELVQYLGVSAQKVRRWMQEGLIRCQRMQTNSPTDPRLVHRNEVRRFVQRNPMAIDLRRVDQLWFLDIVFDGKIGDTVETVLRKTATSKKNSRSQGEILEMAAYHESGHAVMAHVQGRRVKPVSVGKRANTSRRVSAHPMSEWSQPNTSSAQVERQVLVIFAGQVAQELLAGGRSCRGEDFPQAKTIASNVAHEETELNAYLRWLRIRARNILRDPTNWAAVKALAQALKTENEIRGVRAIGGRQAKAIITQALKDEHA